MQNLGLVIFPMLVAFIYTSTNSYEMTLLFFIVILLSAMTIGFHVLHLDKKQNNIMESCSNYEKECAKNNTSTMSKSLMGKEYGECNTDEEKRLLHLSRLLI